MRDRKTMATWAARIIPSFVVALLTLFAFARPSLATMEIIFQNPAVLSRLEISYVGRPGQPLKEPIVFDSFNPNDVPRFARRQGNQTFVDSVWFEGNAKSPLVIQSIAIRTRFGELFFPSKKIRSAFAASTGTLKPDGTLIPAQDGNFSFGASNLIWQLFLSSIKPYALIFWSLLFGIITFYMLTSRNRKRAATFTVAWLAFISLRAEPLSGEVNAPVDLLPQFSGWRTAAPGVWPEHSAHSDTLDVHLPKWRALREGIWQGEFPMWSNSRAGGELGAHLVTLETFNPYVWLYVLTPNEPIGFLLMQFAKLLMIGLGSYFFCVRFLSHSGAIVAALTFMLCGFNAAWFYTPVVSTASWVPWVLLAWDRFRQSPGPKQALGFAAAAFLVGNAGFPAVAIYAIYALGIFHLTFAPWGGCKERWKTWAFTSVVMAGVGLSVVAISATTYLALVQQLSEVSLAYRRGTSSRPSWEFLWTIFDYSNSPEPAKERLFFAGRMTIVGLLLSIPLILLTRRISAAKSRFVLASLLVFLFTAGVIFNIFPRSLVDSMPTFKTNLVTRFIVMTHFSLACLLGAAVSFVPKFIPKPLPIALFVCGFWLFLGFHWFDLTRQFNDLNGTSPARAFRPKTPTIDFLSTRLEPLQSVLADVSFGVGGMLGNYGLSEWCAHTFKPEPVRNVLLRLVERGMPTATSCLFTGAQVQVQAPEFAHLGIRYVAVEARWAEILRERILRLDLSERWLEHRLEPNVVLFENAHTPKGAYSLNVLDVAESPKSVVGLTSTAVSDGRYELNFSDEAQGQWVILPVRATKQFSATWNGSPIETSLHLGILPAFRVPGAGSFVYSFNSPNALKAFSITLGGAFGLLAIVLMLKKKKISGALPESSHGGIVKHD